MSRKRVNFGDSIEIVRTLETAQSFSLDDGSELRKRPAAFAHPPATKAGTTWIVTNLVSAAECLLSPKAVIQIEENRVKRTAAFGQKRTLNPTSVIAGGQDSAMLPF